MAGDQDAILQDPELVGESVRKFAITSRGWAADGGGEEIEPWGRDGQMDMTALYFTIDTEYSPGLTARGGRDTRQENFARSIACTTSNGAVGVGYQLDVFDRCGLKAVFFVDPMPALLWGVEAIADVIGPIIERGHDVQLHVHTEWLVLAGVDNPLGSRTGTNLKDFTFEEQCLLLRGGRAASG